MDLWSSTRQQGLHMQSATSPLRPAHMLQHQLALNLRLTPARHGAIPTCSTSQQCQTLPRAPSFGFTPPPGTQNFARQTPQRTNAKASASTASVSFDTTSSISPLEAAKQGKLGIGFSAGGLLFPYFIGVAAALEELGVLRKDTPVAGASAGSLIAACCKSGVPWEDIITACNKLSHDCRTKGTRFRLRSVLKQTLYEVLPTDIHERCSGQVYVAVTKLVPEFRPQLVYQYTNKEDLVNSLLTSCHIPWYFDGGIFTQYRDGLYFDGGVTNFLPVPPAENTIKVSCFGTQQLRFLRDIDIAPDSFETWPHDINQMLAWAFEPAPEKWMEYLVDKGKKDARAWAAANGTKSQGAALQQPVNSLL